MFHHHKDFKWLLIVGPNEGPSLMMEMARPTSSDFNQPGLFLKGYTVASSIQLMEEILQHLGMYIAYP